jgi:hypothetical protein
MTQVIKSLSLLIFLSIAGFAPPTMVPAIAAEQTTGNGTSSNLKQSDREQQLETRLEQLLPAEPLTAPDPEPNLELESNFELGGIPQTKRKQMNWTA